MKLNFSQIHSMLKLKEYKRLSILMSVLPGKMKSLWSNNELLEIYATDKNLCQGAKLVLHNIQFIIICNSKRIHTTQCLLILNWLNKGGYSHTMKIHAGTSF